MFAKVDPATLVIGSLSGFAALVVAINTVLLRRDARRHDDGMKRVSSLEFSQTSMKDALARADLENERLRKERADTDAEYAKQRERWQREQEKQEDEIITLERRVAALEAEVAGLRNGK